MIVVVGLGMTIVSPAVGVVILGYGFAARHLAIRRLERIDGTHRRAAALERLSGVVADVRAGAAVPLFALPDRELDRMARAAQRLSDRTGAPLADLLERLESHHIALSRLDSAAEAQAAGIRLTGILLTLLPIAGLGLGHAMGVNPIGFLLGSEIGAVCVALAVGLQLTGFAWSDRLAHPRAHGARSLTEFAVAADLLAVTLRTGLPVGAAVSRVGDALEGWLSERLVQIGRELQAGVAPRQAWQRLLTADPAEGRGIGLAKLLGTDPAHGSGIGLAPGPAGLASGRLTADIRRRSILGLGRRLAARRGSLASILGPAWRLVNAARRSAESGAAMSGALSRCADDIRADVAHARQAQVQRMGVLMVFPLALCFLPAFVFGGLVPVVLAMLGELLSVK